MGPNASKGGKESRTDPSNLTSPVTFGGKSKKGVVDKLQTHSRDHSSEKRKPKLHATVFSWPHGGKQVYITGTFNSWKTRIPMQRDGTEFHTVLTLPEGEHLYKYIVDEEWSFAPDQPTATDAVGNVTNVVYVKGETDENLDEEELNRVMGDKMVTFDEDFGQKFPDVEGYKKDPPNLPPHLFRSVLDSATLGDPTVLALPSHVMLNHLYSFSQRQEGVIALGLTHRYKEKFITTVFYRPHVSAAGPLSTYVQSNLVLEPESEQELNSKAPLEAIDVPATPVDNVRDRASSGGAGGSERAVTGARRVVRQRSWDDKVAAYSTIPHTPP